MAKITVDGLSYEVNPDNNLLQECLSQGLDLPYFCWHPCMGSVGACRQCAVKTYRDAEDKNGTLVMACMTPASDGAIVSIEDEQASAFRAGVIESLMTSHPHDCPVCEEGGECHLQDMTQMSGHNYRRYDKLKVTHRNQDLGPFLNHEMNRCITCYRCVRFYDDYAGGTDLAAQASHHHTYFGRFEDGTLESEFSGNLAEVCPTGVFTDKPFSEHYTRKWDLQVAPSVCTGCAVGCNTTPGERYGSLRRVVNRYNSEINGYFLCDRGRFGAHYVNTDNRLRSAKDAAGMTLSTEEAEEKLAAVCAQGAIGIGSPRASVEANFALRCLVGEDNYYSGESAQNHEALQWLLSCLEDEAFSCPTIKEMEGADAVLVLGEDVTNTAPRVALALRQSVRSEATRLAAKARIPSWQDAAVRELAQEAQSPLALFSTGATRLDDVASTTLNADPASLLAAAKAVDVRLAGGSPDYDALIPEASSGASKGETMQAVESVCAALIAAQEPLIVCGSHAGVELMRVAASIARTLSALKSAPCALALLPAEDNSVGHAMLVRPQNTLAAALTKLSDGAASAVIIIENDLTRRAPSAAVTAALQAAEQVVVVDHLNTATTRAATLALPSTSFNEYESSRVNYEGRAQLSFQVSQYPSGTKPVEHWLGVDGALHSASLIARCSAEAAGFASLPKILPDALTRVAGLKVPRQSHRYSGRTAMNANVAVNEGKQAVDENSVMAFSMEGALLQQDASVLASPWAPRWSSNQSITKFQAEVGGELKQEQKGVHLLTRSVQSAVVEPDSHVVSGATDPATKGELGVHFVQQIFGSDELSAHSPAIRERLCDAYVALSPPQAASLGATTGDRLVISGTTTELSLVVRTQTPDTVAMIYPGTSAAGESINALDLPHRITLTRAPDQEAGAASLGLAALIVGDAVFSHARAAEE